VKILALDTATENCSAALLIDGSVLAREIETDRGHAARILSMIDDLLCEAHLELSDLNAIAFGRGPGSFTGVRLAATVTQGLAFGADLGVVPISDLQAVAQRTFAIAGEAARSNDRSRVLVCNDARMSEVYWACFELGEDGLARLEGEEHVSKPSEVRLPASWTTATAAGRGFIAYAAALSAAVPVVAATLGQPTLPSAIRSDAAPTDRSDPAPTINLSPSQLLPRATEIALLAVPTVAAGRLLPPEAATPTYLRNNVAHVAQPAKPSK
jgi:tRNA threonylcarbamoyladenosine biosynthesis protein TsaB